MTLNNADPVEVFFCYSHHDEALRDKLEKHLGALLRAHIITGWHDRRITAGTEWKGEIDTHLNSASIVLLLISKDFVASDYCHDIEMKRALERHEAGDTRVIPILLRPVDWDGLPFSKLQALPKDAKPISKWGNRDEAFVNVAKGVRNAVLELHAGTGEPTVNQGYVDNEGTIGPSESASKENIATACDPVDIEVTLNRDFATFSEVEKRKVLAAIGILLDISDIKVIRERPGSVKLTLRLPRVKAKHLLWAIGRGSLEDFGVVDAEVLQLLKPDAGGKVERAALERPAWVEELQSRLVESDRMIRAASLDDGWKLVKHRGRAIHDAMSRFFEQVVQEAQPQGAFAIHAVGGTGRQEICPGSDVDIGIIVENIEENEHFFRHVSRQLKRYAPDVPGLGNAVKANAFPDLGNEEHFDLKSLAALLDSDLLVGDPAFHDRIRRVCQRRAAELGLEFIFAITHDLRRFDQLYPQLPGDIGGFHVKNGIGGLRNFQLTMWLYSFERWIPSVQIYEQVRSTSRFDSEGAPTSKVLDAVSVILCARCWIEQRRAAQSKDDNQEHQSGLVIDVADMKALLERFGAEGLTRLNTARETINSYRHETLDRLLEHGVAVPGTDGLVVWGSDGLRIGADALFKDATQMFYAIYEAQQRFHLPIDKRVKRAARKNIAESLRRDPAFINLLVSSEPAFPSLKDWWEYGVLDQLVPGFGELANRLYRPDHRAATLTRAARAMQRLESLEHLSALKLSEVSSREAYFVRQYQDIGASARGALRFALLSEEIPETLYDTQTYAESVKKYTHECLTQVPGLSGPTLRTIEFLLLTKRELLKASETSDEKQVLESWRHKIAELKSRDPADTIRALGLFAYAAFDFHNPKDAPRERLDFEQWQNVQNLTQNLLYDELGVDGQPFEDLYFDELGKRIGSLLPRRLLASPHVDNSLKQTYEGAAILDPQRAHRIILALKEVVQKRRPKVELKRDEEYYRLTLFAWDFPGLFWRVSAALFDMGCSIRSTDLYAIPDPSGQAADGEALIPNEQRLIYDVLTFDATSDSSESWEDEIKGRIMQRLENPKEEIPDNVGEILAPVREGLHAKLTDIGGGFVKFSCHSPASNKGTRYAISRLLSERADASIESIARDGTHDWPIPRTNFYIRIQSDLSTVAQALSCELGEISIKAEALS